MPRTGRKEHPRLVETLGCFDETEGAGRGQFLAIDMTWEVHRHLEDHVANQWQVLLDQLVNGIVPGSLHISPFP